MASKFVSQNICIANFRHMISKKCIYHEFDNLHENTLYMYISISFKCGLLLQMGSFSRQTNREVTNVVPYYKRNLKGQEGRLKRIYVDELTNCFFLKI